MTPMKHPEELSLARLDSLIADVPDFPKPGIVFKDITPLLRDPSGLGLAMEFVAEPYRAMHVDVVVGVESRGFIFAMAVAAKMSAGFVPVRKPGRLPRKTKAQDYQLEYGSNTLEIHEDAIRPGDRVLLVDDLLATGGTMGACCKLVESLDGIIVGTAFLIELTYLKGREKIGDYPFYSVLKYDKP